MKDTEVLSSYYATLGASIYSGEADLRHARNLRLLELNDPRTQGDWRAIDQKTRAIQQAYFILKNHRLNRQ